MKKKDAKTREKASLLARLSQYTDVSLCVFTDFRIQVERLGRQDEKGITACGVQGILQMDSDCVRLSYGTEVLCIQGMSLECRAYADGAVRVCGHIGSLCFEEKTGA